MRKLLILIMFQAGIAQASGFIATSEYKTTNINGFVVLISPKVVEQKQLLSDVTNEIINQTEFLLKVFPDDKIKSLLQVKIWVEFNAKIDGGAEFHPSKIWLSSNGYNPDKALGIEISNSINFVSWSRTHQPCMIIHELAHAYHFVLLGESFSPIENAYNNAKASGLYNIVEYVDGRRLPSYALNNSKEYFAELTEAYFGKNDYYPFTKAELYQYDKVGYQLMMNIWGSK